MSQDAGSFVEGSWRLRLALPAAMRSSREALGKFVVEVAEGRVAAPIRRSRHACTFRAQFAPAEGPTVTLFVKVIEPPERIRRLKQVFRGTPADHVARITAELAAVGLSAPAVWLYGRDLKGRRELLVTPRAEGMGPLPTLAALAGAPAVKRRLLTELGKEIARLHHLGFVHGDLTPFNIFIVCDDPPRFVLLDHERTRRAFFLGCNRRQLRNLVQLGRFALPGVSRTDRLRTLSAYVAGVNRRDPRALMRRINAMLLRRIRRDGGFEEVPRTSAAVAPAVSTVQARV